jgi:lysophospholipase L1-like esterase
MWKLIATAVVVLLLASLVGNLLQFQFAQSQYAKAKGIAVFPSNEQHYRIMNRGLLPKTGKRIVLFGDSRIEQWQTLPVIANAEFINRGISGETTAQMRMRFEQDVLALDPDLVILQLGINDLTGIGVMPERQSEIALQCASNIQFFVDQLAARNVRVILLSIIPAAAPAWLRLPVWSDQINVAVEKVNQHWLGLPASNLLRVVDTRSVLQDKDGHWYPGVNADTLHLTAGGYQRLNQVVAPLIEER